MCQQKTFRYELCVHHDLWCKYSNFNLCACRHLLLYYQLHYILFCPLTHLTESLKYTNFYNLLSEDNLDLNRHQWLRCWCVKIPVAPLITVRVHIPMEGNSRVPEEGGVPVQRLGHLLLNYCLLTIPEH